MLERLIPREVRVYASTRSGQRLYRAARSRDYVLGSANLAGAPLEVITPVEESSGWISPSHRLSLEVARRTYADAQSSVEAAREEMRDARSELRHFFSVSGRVTRTDLMGWAREKVPPVENIMLGQDGTVVVDFIACEAQLRLAGYGGFEGERMLIPAMRMVFGRPATGVRAYSRVHGNWYVHRNAHPHALGGGGLCLGGFEELCPSLDMWMTDPHIAITGMITILREWRRAWCNDPGANVGGAKAQAFDNFRADPQCFSPIEGLDGEIYPDVATLLEKTPRGVSSGAPPIVVCRNCSVVPCACCQSCGYLDCECTNDDYCGNCDRVGGECQCVQCPRCTYRFWSRNPSYMYADFVSCHNCDYEYCGFCGLSEGNCSCTRCDFCGYNKEWADIEYGLSRPVCCGMISPFAAVLAVLQSVSYPCWNCGRAISSCRCNDRLAVEAIIRLRTEYQQFREEREVYSRVFRDIASFFRRSNPVCVTPACAIRYDQCSCGPNYRRCTPCQAFLGIRLTYNRLNLLPNERIIHADLYS